MYSPSCPRWKPCRLLHAISAALRNTSCAPVSLPFRDLSNPFFVVSLELPRSTIWNPFTTGSPIESSVSCCFWTKRNVFTAASVSRFIFAHSNRFGLLAALTSKLPSEDELAEVSYVCSQPSCHPTELQSSFHSSKLQSSFHSSPFQPSFQ